MWNDLSVSIFPWTEWSWFEFSSRFVAHSYTLKTNSKLWEAKYSWWSACRATRRTGVQFSALSWRNTTWLCMLMTSALRRLRQVAGQASQPSLICKIPARESITKQTNSNNNKKKKHGRDHEEWHFWLTSGLQTRVCMHVCAHSPLKRYTHLPILYTHLQKTTSLISEHLKICPLKSFLLKQQYSSLVSGYCGHTNEGRNVKTIFPHCLKWQALLN